MAYLALGCAESLQATQMRNSIGIYPGPSRLYHLQVMHVMHIVLLPVFTPLGAPETYQGAA